MIEPAPRQKNRSSLAARLSPLVVLGAILSACGPTYFEIPIETPIQAKLDVSAFQRVLIAGFVTGGTDDVDANQETVRLLRSQLRSKSELRVIDSDVMELAEIARDQQKSAAAESDEPATIREAGRRRRPRRPTAICRSRFRRKSKMRKTWSRTNGSSRTRRTGDGSARSIRTP
jgi:hypothetical protein